MIFYKSNKGDTNHIYRLVGVSPTHIDDQSKSLVVFKKYRFLGFDTF